MSEYFASLPTLLTTMVVAYVLGALPLADQISRRNGVDIFSTGTGLAGATNVRKEVGRVPAFFVLVGDLGKGALAILVAKLMGLEAPLILLPAAAAVVGHWKSVFSGFRGGDGLVTLGGAIIAMLGSVGVIGIAASILVAFGGQRLPYSSLFSIVFGYATIAALSVAYDRETTIVLGIGGLCALVLAFALNGHRRRRQTSEWTDLEEPESATEQSSS